MDLAEGLGLLLAFIASGLTVTPRIQNWWMASVAWLVTALYATWLVSSRQVEIQEQIARHPILALVGVLAICLIAATAIGGAIRRRMRGRKHLTDDELGVFEHGRRIEPTWGRIARLRGGIFKAMTATNEAARARASEVDAAKPDRREQVLERAMLRAAKDMRRPVRRLERLAAQYVEKVAELHESYKRVLPLVGADVIFPKAIESFKKRQLPHYDVRRQLPDDIRLFECEQASLKKLRGQRSELTRECDKYIAAMEKITEGSRELLLVCEKAHFVGTHAPQLARLREGTPSQQSLEQVRDDSLGQLPSQR